MPRRPPSPARAPPRPLTLRRAAEAAPAEPPKTFETYVAPPPSQPPTSVPALTPAPAAAVPAPPAPEPVAPAPEPAAPAPELIADTMMPSSLPTTPPKRPAEPKPAGEAGGRPRWLLPAAIGTGVVVLIVIAVIALGGGGDDTPTPTPTPQPTEGPAVALTASGIGLEVPAGWSEGGEAPQIPGFADGAVSAGGKEGGAIVFGKADKSAANSSLLAGDLRAAAGETLPEKTPVDLGDGLQAGRYAELPIGEGNTATVFVVPTSEGVATLACTAPEATCDSIAQSLEDHRGRGLPGRPERRVRR